MLINWCSPICVKIVFCAYRFSTNQHRSAWMCISCPNFVLTKEERKKRTHLFIRVHRFVYIINFTPTHIALQVIYVCLCVCFLFFPFFLRYIPISQNKLCGLSVFLLVCQFCCMNTNSKISSQTQGYSGTKMLFDKMVDWITEAMAKKKEIWKW